MKSLIRNINVLNIALTVALTFFVLFAASPLRILQVKYALPDVKKQGGELPENVPDIQTPSPADFITVAEQNLFHPERKIPVEKKEEQPLPKPEFVLYGTLITDTVNLAYMEDIKAPRSSQGRGKRQTALKKGDVFSGFTLSEIFHDKVVMIRGNEKVEVTITDNRKARSGDVSSPDKIITQTPQQQPTVQPPRASLQSQPPSSAPSAAPQAGLPRGKGSVRHSPGQPYRPQ